MKVTLQRFGKNLRLVLMLEWLTLWPVWGALAVSSQRRDMVSKSSKRALARQEGGGGGQSRVLSGTGGRIGKAGASVKAGGARRGCKKPRFVEAHQASRGRIRL